MAFSWNQKPGDRLVNNTKVKDSGIISAATITEMRQMLDSLHNSYSCSSANGTVTCNATAGYCTATVTCNATAGTCSVTVTCSITNSSQYIPNDGYCSNYDSSKKQSECNDCNSYDSWLCSYDCSSKDSTNA